MKIKTTVRNFAISAAALALVAGCASTPKAEPVEEPVVEASSGAV